MIAAAAAPVLGPSIDPPQSGWQACLDLDVEERGGRSVLVRNRHRGPLRVQRPFHPEGAPCHIYLLHPPGGVVGGDRLDIQVRVGEGAHALLTTPGAAKFYRSAGALAQLDQRLQVASGGVLEWFPQENILFPGARLQLRTEVDLALGARFIGWEVQTLGRPAIGERFDRGAADLGLVIRRAGVPLLLERLRVFDGAGLDGASTLRGFPVTATLVASGADTADLAALRAGTDPAMVFPWAATLVGDLLIARALAPAVEPVHRLFRAIWGLLRPRLLARDACPPRIWAT